MVIFIGLTLCAIVILKPSTGSCYNIGENPELKIEDTLSYNNNAGGLETNVLRESRNASIFNSNYAKVPAKLLDPNYGIINYEKKNVNSSRERDLMLLESLDQMRDIDLDAEKYANVFSKAFAAGYSAAIVDKLSQQRNNNNPNSKSEANSNIETPKEDVVNVTANNLNNNTVREAKKFARNKMHAESMKQFAKNPGNLPFNISSDAVGYGAAYASGYALAAADRAARVSNFNHSDMQPWKMNDAAAAGYAAYYASAIAQTRAVREPQRKQQMLQDVGKEILIETKDRKMDEDSHIKTTKDLVVEHNLNNEGTRNESRIIRDETVITNNLEESQDFPLNSDLVFPSEEKVIRDEPALVAGDAALVKDDKKQRNVEIYEPSEVNSGTQDLTVNIEQNPLGGAGTIRNASSLFQNDITSNKNKGDENVVSNLKIQDSNNKRYVSDEIENIANKSVHMGDNIGLQNDVNQEHRQLMDESGHALISANEGKLYPVMVVPLQNNMKRKRSWKFGKRRKRKKKNKKSKSIINYGSL